MNGADEILKTLTTYCEKIIIWTMFQNSKIGTLIKEKYIHYYDNNIESKWTPLNLSSNIEELVDPNHLS